MTDVLLERSGAVVTVTLNRPERKNALTIDGFNLLGEVFEELAVDDSVRAVVITGAAGNFCTGSDLSKRRPEHPNSRMRRLNRAATIVAEFPKPLVAAVEGFAVGAGWNLALLCDLVVASRTAQFSQIFARRGLSVDFGGSWILPRLVGLHTAKRLVMLAEMLDAEQAHALGLISYLVEPNELDTRAAEIAASLASGPPVALAASAALLERGATSSLADALAGEAASQAVNMATDGPGAMKAFVERRPAEFTGDWQVSVPQ